MPAKDNANSVQGTAVSNLTTSAWTIAGSSRLLVAGMGWSAGAPPTYSEMRWEGSGGTLLTQVGSTVSSGFGRCAMARLIAPNAASGTLYGALSGSTDEFCIGGVSITEANQGTPLGTPATNTGSSLTATVDVASESTELVIDMAYAENGAAGTGSVAAGAGQTLGWEQENIAGLGVAGTQSTEPGATTVTMSEVYTMSGGSPAWGIIAVGIKSSVTPVPAQRSRFNSYLARGIRGRGLKSWLTPQSWW